MTTIHNITIKQGDDITRTLTIRKAGVLFPLTGCTFAFALARKASRRNNEPQIFQTTWVFDPTLPLGVTVFALSDTLTESLLPRDYAYDIKIKDATGAVKTLLTGGIRVLPTPVTPF